MSINRRLTDLTEKTTIPDNAWLHFVDPNDLTDSASGSDFKVKKSTLIPPSSAPFVPYTGIFVWETTNTGQTFTIPTGVVVRQVFLEDGRLLHKTLEWSQVGQTLTISYVLENGNRISMFN